MLKNLCNLSVNDFFFFCFLILKYLSVNFAHKTFKTFDYLPVSLCCWSQTIQKHIEAVSALKSLCIPYVSLINEDAIPFLFSEAVVWRSSV